MRSRLGNLRKIFEISENIARDWDFSYIILENLRLWLIFLCILQLQSHTVIVLLPRKQREKLPRSRNLRSNCDPGHDLHHKDGHVWVGPSLMNQNEFSLEVTNAVIARILFYVCWNIVWCIKTNFLFKYCMQWLQEYCFLHVGTFSDESKRI